MRTASILAVATLLFAQGEVAFAACEPANSQACINMRQAEETYKRMEQEKQREQMRDTRHDNRLKIDNNTSVGVSPNGVNIKKTY